MQNQEQGIRRTNYRLMYRFVKRTFDIFFSVFALIITSPIFLITAIAIKLEDRGPVIFSQERIGLNGKPFMIYKFRSMVVNAEELRDSLSSKNEMGGPVFKIKDDPRITKVGKFIRKTSIDELPQFVNVLKGDMSIVGPRPPLPREVAEYDNYDMHRLDVKGGLTCIWQIQPNKNNLAFDDIMKLDMEYIRHQSALLDLKIILLTVVAVLRFDGE